MSTAPVVPIPAALTPAAQQLVSGIGDAAVELLRAKRAEVLTELNRRVNLPILSEETEGKLLGAAYDAIVEALDAVL